MVMELCEINIVNVNFHPKQLTNTLKCNAFTRIWAHVSMTLRYIWHGIHISTTHYCIIIPAHMWDSTRFGSYSSRYFVVWKVWYNVFAAESITISCLFSYELPIVIRNLLLSMNDMAGVDYLVAGLLLVWRCWGLDTILTFYVPHNWPFTIIWSNQMCIHECKIVMLTTEVSLEIYWKHYSDVIMTTMGSQITSLIVYSGADHRKHQTSASLSFVRGIHRDWWIPRTKGK